MYVCVCVCACVRVCVWLCVHTCIIRTYVPVYMSIYVGAFNVYLCQIYRPFSRVSYCAVDPTYNKVCCYISRNPETSLLECHAFLCENKSKVCVCVRAYVRACVRACVRA